MAAMFGAALLIAVPFITSKEGERLRAYQDVAGVWTICHGETLGVKPGDRKTKAECDTMTKNRTYQFMSQVYTAIKADVSPEVLAACTSFAYNIGINGFRSSTALKQINAGNGSAGCRAMMNWYTAGGKDCRIKKNGCSGLITRRKAEVDLCLKGVIN
ncbi:lysozyme [Hymenobacter sp. HSC-4F20]|uniref:lysozyme n=1 Tax=Hymenobacter sp. HSC-4F20 TaxID=2864135 RepID=UPI001C72F399|nr:lysozyme [Hymenobacter sp. HSC-4F20]MBX0289732.1 lysozyme [Hymenobacter sp. HSC-4F20]